MAFEDSNVYHISLDNWEAGALGLIAHYVNKALIPIYNSLGAQMVMAVPADTLDELKDTLQEAIKIKKRDWPRQALALDKNAVRSILKKLKNLKQAAVRRSAMATGILEADSYDLIEFAKAWVGMGESVQQQVVDILDVGPTADANPDAVRFALDTIGRLNEEIDYALQEWLES